MSEEEQMKKTERIILDCNKNGLSYLTNGHLNEGFDYLKKAEKAILQQLRINPQHSKFNQLAGITFNNLACYYKKVNKPKVALTYLKKALQIEVFKLEDYSSTASTHLNICAIYSHLKRHEESANHADLAVSLLEKVDLKNLKETQVQSEKSYWNILMLSHYNLAIELEHLKKFDQSKKHYVIAKETAGFHEKKNNNLIRSIDESIERINEEEAINRKKLIELLAKKRITQEKGNHEFMRKNKKNYGNEGQWRALVEAKKYELYKTEHEGKKPYQSSQKIKRLQPINESNLSKRNLLNQKDRQ